MISHFDISLSPCYINVNSMNYTNHPLPLLCKRRGRCDGAIYI